MPEESDDNLNKVKAWLLPGVGAVLMLLLTVQVNNAVKRMDDAVEKVNSMMTRSEVANTQVTYLTERVKQLESQDRACTDARQQAMTRLSSLEQRAATYDQFMQTHK